MVDLVEVDTRATVQPSINVANHDEVNREEDDHDNDNNDDDHDHDHDDGSRYSNDSSSTPSDLPSLRLLTMNDADDDYDHDNNDDESSNISSSSNWDDIPDLVDLEHPLLDTDTNHHHDHHQGQGRGGGTTSTAGDVALFREFCTSLRANNCNELYRYYISRQERLVTLMLRDHGKAEEFYQASRGNTSLEHLHLDISHRYTQEQMAAPNAPGGFWMGHEEYYRRWHIVGQGIGNLMGLQVLQIHAGGYLHNRNTPDFRALAHITEGAQQIQKMVLTFELVQGDQILNFAQSFRNHTKLDTIEFRGFIERQPMEVIATELMTIPNLSRIDMMNCFSRRVPCRILPDSFFALIGKPSMKELILQRCYLSETQCAALAHGLSSSNQNTTTTTTTIECLDLQYSRLQNGALVAASLETNTSIQKVIYSNNSLDQEGCIGLAQALLVNTTITRLQIETEEMEWAPEPPPQQQQQFETDWLDPIFVALQSNATITFLSIGQLCKWNDTTADKFRNALESPTTAITELWIHSRNSAAQPWQRIMPALARNQTLKNLRLLAAVGHQGVIATAGTLAENTTLQALEAYPCSRFVCAGVEDRTIHDIHRKEKITPEDCVTARAVKALGRNTTLKKLMVDTCITHHTKDVSDEGCKQLVAALYKNFGLQDTDMSWGRGRTYKNSMEIITRLNAADRKYLLEDPADRVRGVRLLIEVRDNIDCLFTHLQENPSLCEL